MNFDLSEEQNLLINTTKAFVKDELLQHEELLEKTNNLPKELYDEIKKKISVLHHLPQLKFLGDRKIF